MYDIFGCASDFAHNFRHLMPTTLNCGATVTGQGQVYHCGNCIHLEDLAKVYKIPLEFAKWMDCPPCGDCEPDKNVL